MNRLVPLGNVGFVLLLLLAALAINAVPAPASTYWWDADGDATSAIGGTGTWDASSALWRDGSSTGTLGPWGNANPNSDTAVLAGNMGWVTIPTGTTIYANAVQFDVAGYTLAGADGTSVLYLSGTTPTVNAAQDATISAIVGGAAGLAKTGSGNLLLTGTNTYTGGATLNAGRLTLGSATALGATPGTFAINGGTLDSSVANLVNANNNPQTWNGDFTFAGTQNLNLGTGTISLGTSAGTTRTVTIAANTLTIGGAIYNGAIATGLTVNGAATATLQLNGAANYTGPTVIDAVLVNNNGQSFSTLTTTSSNTITLQNGGRLSNVFRLEMGTGTAANNNAMVVTGRGSRFDLVSANSCWYMVGVYGSNNSLTISNSGYFRHPGGNGTTNAYVGQYAGANGNSLTVTSGGTLSQSGQRLYIGGAGSANSLIVSAGGKTQLRLFEVGGGGSNNTVTITGNGSSLSAAEDMFIGDGASGTGNAVTVSNGGYLVTQTRSGKTELSTIIGCDTGANNNSLTITGSTSQWIDTGLPVLIGGSRYTTYPAFDWKDARNNSLNVVSGASASVPAVILSGSNSSFNLGDGLGISSGTVTSESGVPAGGCVSLSVADARLNINSGRLTMTTSGALVTGPGQVVLNGPAYISISYPNPMYGSTSFINSPISGSGSLTKEGAYELSLTASNTYTGDTIVNQGTLTISNPYLYDTAAVKIGSGAVMNLNFSGADTVAELWLGGSKMAEGTYSSSTPTYGSYFGGTGSLLVGAALVFSGTATWNISGSGAWNANASWSDTGTPGALGVPGITGTGQTAIFDTQGAGPNVVTLGAVSPRLAAMIFQGTTPYTVTGATAPNRITLTSSSGIATLTVSGTAAQQIDVPVTLAGSTLVTSGSGSTLLVSGNIGGAGGLTLTSASSGKLVLSGSNDYNGFTTVNGGTLQLDGRVAGNGVNVNNSATINGSGTIETDLLYHSAGSSTFNGHINGDGVLELSGTVGTLTLGGSNGYSGGTTVSAGTLDIALADALPKGKNLSIGSGGHVALSAGLSRAISLGGLTITSGAGGETSFGAGLPTAPASGAWSGDPAPTPLAAAPTPEPGTLVLLAAGAAAGLATCRRRNRRL